MVTIGGETLTCSRNYRLRALQTPKNSKVGWKYKKLQSIEDGESARKIPKRHVCHTKLGERALKP